MPSSAVGVAPTYVRLVNEGRLAETVDLYAEDGEALPPNPAYEPVIRGRAALREHYQRSVGRRLPKIEITHLYEAGDTRVVELSSGTVDEDQPWGVLDIFTVRADGLVTRMAAYRRPLARVRA
ncbi:nuclear transport factor 2 family protein [Pseudofrankia asymbiotica]|uniref:SnoaL-like domain-containing protein n=1 Tax=Pseudofrankia asymbiotica TaxID=1834516 RepID=A0A1V2I7J9_9ACTN|nr:nuclear transport factor 2 family protein [Pseudofrankia asymbiotica]ONH28015.1 hypothetical protein BL253_20640 [Pseudofrankia asymbiotica]